ncbi:MAG: Major facilitator superfamily MFS_1 [Methanomicrobiales archaeon 53_19]|jgi:MFS family permease|uniref:L-lactate MFS transporter n=1 Tax=Methanocalculus sp. TaxID=2004547 RepID=UPI00074AA857|nr:OFA family MFS transporter [Methanocalculus sp.]KUK70492.1 MAG: Major facilitator superfamily MFS_1 [Methanocalculus sp. 52_23]KUL03587.1 MAG: Major facilitator superfamily MFS_1 [Methanomicrobiales archaeon 53_19]HIJ06401.1 OFA family MFS transporter [Methanocalculus sp.]
MKETHVFGLPLERGRWIFVLLGLIINICLGSIYAWSVFVAPLTEYFTTELHLSVTAGEVLMPFSIFLAAFAIAMPLTGRYIDEWGPRKTTIIGGVLTALGWMLASTATSVEMLYLVYGVIGGAGVGIAYGVPVALATRWFPDRRGFAVGLALLGFGFSAFISANIAGILIPMVGVMHTFRIFGAAFLIITLLCSMPLRFPETGWVPHGWAPPASAVTETCECDRSRMIRTPTFYGLWICYFIGCLAGLMAISISQPVGVEVVGITPVLATALVGIFAIFNGGGRPAFGWLTDLLRPKNTAMISFLLIAAASLLLWQVPSQITYIVAFCILWGCLGGWLAIAPTATARYFGTCDYPRCYGLVFLAYGAGAIAGPQLAGFIRDSTGSYIGVFPYIMVLAIIGAVIGFFLLRPVVNQNE